MKKKTARHVEQGAVDFLLTGKAFCGHCRSAMIGDSGTSKAGNRFYYYSCQAHKARKGCPKKSIGKDRLEDAVIDFVLDYVLSDEMIEQTADAIMALQAEELKSSPLAAMEAEQAEVKKQIDNINNAIAAGVWSSSTVEKLKALEATAENLRVSIETLRFSQTQLMDRDRVVFFLHRFTKGDRNDPLHRQHLIQTFVNSVYVYDDHLWIVVNNTEGNFRYDLPDDLLEDSPGDSPSECSDSVSSGVPNVLHPNTRVTAFRLAI